MSYGKYLNLFPAAEKLIIKNGMYWDISGNVYPNLALIKLDKCMWLPEIRPLLVGLCVEDNGHVHEDFHVQLFPDEIFQQDGMIFIPAISWKCPAPEKVPVPIWMIDFLLGQFKRIIKIAAAKGIVLTKLDLMKPKVAIGASERVEYEGTEGEDYFFEN